VPTATAEIAAAHSTYLYNFTVVILTSASFRYTVAQPNIMSSNNDNTIPEGYTRPRHGSVTTQTFTNLFNRSNSTVGGPTSAFPGPVTTGAPHDQRRRVSISTLALAGTSPSQTSPFPFGGRRGSVSTAGSDSVDESAIDDEEGPGRSMPTTPFARRMSFGAQALRSVRTGNGSPGTAEGSGFNWSEQLRSRAESSVSQSQRPTFSTSPSDKQMPFHVPAYERTKSVSEMPAPPTTANPPPVRPVRKQPDAFQERILKGDFYMD